MLTNTCWEMSKKGCKVLWGLLLARINIQQYALEAETLILTKLQLLETEIKGNASIVWQTKHNLWQIIYGATDAAEGHSPLRTSSQKLGRHALDRVHSV